MKLTNIANFKTINEFVKYKSQKLAEGEQTFYAVFQLMFLEENNVFWESNDGYRIIKKSYGEVKKEIFSKTYCLQEKLKGIERGSVIGLHMQNSLEWIEIFWSILACGYNPFLLNARIDKNTLEDAIKISNAKAVITDSEEFSVRTVFSSEIVCGDKESNSTSFGEEILLMTSGTSNVPKICAYDASAIIKQILNAKELAITSSLVKKHYEGELKLLTFLPFYHIFGLIAMYMWFAFFSRTFVHLKDMSAQCILNTIRRHKVTHIFAVPLFWNTIYDGAIKKVKERGEKTFKKLQKGLKISHFLSGVPFLARSFRKKAFKEVRDKLFGESVCFMITGGGCISAEVIQFFNGVGYPLANGYGMTEIGVTSVELSADNRVLNSRSIGKPVPSVEYKITKEGALLVKGDSLCKYYIEDGKKIYINGEWFDTKDLAREEKGRFFLSGRMDELIVSSSGENINPNLYEYSFNINHVKKVCIIDGRKNGAPYPILLASVSKYLNVSTRKKIVREIKEKLTDLKLLTEIKEVVLVGEDLIKGNEFKLNRKRLENDYNSGKLNLLSIEDDSESEKVLDQIDEQISLCFERVLGKKIEKDADFFVDAGGSSLEYFTLVTYIQEEFEVIIPFGNDKKLTSISDFSAYVKGNM